MHPCSIDGRPWPCLQSPFDVVEFVTRVSRVKGGSGSSDKGAEYDPTPLRQAFETAINQLWELHAVVRFCPSPLFFPLLLGCCD